MNKLFVGNLSWNITDEGLRQAFEAYGDVSQAKVITDRYTGQSRGFGFVTFQEPSSANRAIDAMNGSDLDGRPINVDIAKERSRDAGPSW